MAIMDPRGQLGQYLRGSNVYNGGTNNAQSGPGTDMGRPPADIRQAMLRRLNGIFSDPSQTAGTSIPIRLQPNFRYQQPSQFTQFSNQPTRSKPFTG